MCTLKKYREYDPNTIEAVQFTGENGGRDNKPFKR